MKASRANVLFLFAFGFFASFPALGDVVIPGSFTGASDSVYGSTPARAVERAAVAAINAAWQQSYGNCTLSSYSNWPNGNHYAASAIVNCTKPGTFIPVVVIFTFPGATDWQLDIGLSDESKAIDTAVMRAEAAARAEGYSQCVLKGYNTWKPEPNLPKWMASAVVDCKKSVSVIQP
jgi:hypothetical protein